MTWKLTNDEDYSYISYILNGIIDLKQNAIE